ALVISLPWSTSATSILVVLWLLALLPTLDGASVRAEIMTPAGGLPVLLWALGVIGMFWADASWAERFGGLGSFHKLLAIPLLMAHLRGSEIGTWLIGGFLASAAALMIASWGHAVLWPRFMPNSGALLGIPVKDYISQSAVFQICIFGLIYAAID